MSLTHDVINQSPIKCFTFQALFCVEKANSFLCSQLSNSCDSKQAALPKFLTSRWLNKWPQALIVGPTMHMYPAVDGFRKRKNHPLLFPKISSPKLYFLWCPSRDNPLSLHLAKNKRDDEFTHFRLPSTILKPSKAQKSPVKRGPKFHVFGNLKRA